MKGKQHQRQVQLKKRGVVCLKNKNKKNTCFTCRFLENKEFVFHFVPYLLTQWCISSLNGRYQED